MEGFDEHYAILSSQGVMEVGSLFPTQVSKGDVVAVLQRGIAENHKQWQGRLGFLAGRKKHMVENCAPVTRLHNWENFMFFYNS